MQDESTARRMMPKREMMLELSLFMILHGHSSEMLSLEVNLWNYF